MLSDVAMLTLHDRVTRGEVVSSEEQAQLDLWYAEQDRAEYEMLRLDAAEPSIVDLQSEIAAILDRCVLLTQQIRDLTRSNESAQREIVRLRQRVAQHLQVA